MSFGIYSDIYWTGDTVYGFAAAWDLGGCTHSQSVMSATLNSPTRSTNVFGYTSAEASLPFQGEEGGWTLDSAYATFCDCAGTVVAAYDQELANLELLPTWLTVVSDTFLSPPGDGLIYNRERTYQVHDQFGAPLEKGGYLVAEDYSNPSGQSNPCFLGVPDTDWTLTNNQGRFADNYYMGGSPPANCQSAVTQRIWVDGRKVLQHEVIYTDTTVAF